MSHTAPPAATSRLQIDLTVSRSDFSLDVALDLPGQGITAVFGPSGCGKTTLLRAVAGLDRARGRVATGATVWQDDSQGHWMPSHQRALGLVFQDARLFPHLSVEDNLRFGWRRVLPAARRLAWDDVIGWLDLGPLLGRRPHTLSGGERQRVAMGRALLSSPALLLMDEPLAALDVRRKQELLPYLERLHRHLQLPVLYVSHAPDEVARLADHLVVLDAGRVKACGPLAETLARSELAAYFGDEAGVLIEAQPLPREAADEADSLWPLAFEGHTLWVSAPPARAGHGLARCRILARDVSVALAADPHHPPPSQSSILNRFAGQIETIAPTSNAAHRLVRVRVGQTAVLARLTQRSVRELALAPGQQVTVQVKAVALVG